MSDFRDRLGTQLAAAAASLAAVPETDFKVRFGAQLSIAAAELAAGYAPVAAGPAPRRRRAVLGGRHPGRRRELEPGLVLADFRARFGLALASAASDLARARRPVRVRRRLRVWPWLTRPVAIGLATTAFAGTAFAAVAIWTPLLGNPQYGYNPGAATSAPPADQLAALAVLRRPQTDADRGALSQAALTYINNNTKGVRTAYVRLLATVDGAAFVLVPVEERDLNALTGGAVPGSAPLKNALCIYASDPQAVQTQVQCWSLAEVTAGTAWGIVGGRLFGLAPDGATAATFSTPTTGTLSSPVAQNFYTLSLPPGGPPVIAGTAVAFSR